MNDVRAKFKHIEPGDRFAFVGATGTGKSFNATAFLQSITEIPYIIVDTKGSATLERYGWRVITDLAELKTIGQNPHAPNEKVIFRTDVFDSDEVKVQAVEIICRYAYLRQNIGVYIDEFGEVCPNAAVYPKSTRGIATRGREKVVPLAVGTQRPTGVPLFSISEANHYVIGFLSLEQDKKRMSIAAEREISDLIGSLEDRQFLYVCPRKRIVSGPHWFE